ncbi:cholesterol 25-hydroxylase-like protein [Brachyhypopomus gauderio]|uniref:cholesterol 25-hydroxylase-like protein n=1 Tax=Brachyhypopomus gauderio TaxID=698409 RepID=UPI0040423E64
MTDDFALFAGNSTPLLQPVWNLMRDHQSLLLSPFWTTTAGFLVHVLFSSLFMILDLLSPHILWINKYRISEEVVELRQWLHCVWQISTKYVVGVLPVAALVQFVRGNRFLHQDNPAPSVFLACSECFSCLLVFDTLYFIIHYSLHRNPHLYRTFHQAHHTRRDPFALSAQDSSAVELMVQQVLAVSSAALLGCHPLSEVLFHLVNMWLAVEDHCGYDLPWGLHHVLPCFGGSPFHQAHHRRIRGNFAPYFRHWDLICGTLLPDFEGTSGSAHTGLGDK